MAPRQSSVTVTPSCFQSDIESSSGSLPDVATCQTPLSELALRLKQRVAMEQQGTPRTYRPSVEELLFEPETTDNNTSAVEIKNMDLLFRAVETSMDLDSYDSSSSSSCDTSTTTSSEEEGARLRERNSRPLRRCQFLNRQNIGAHLHLPSELTVDSLRLARTCMEKKHDENDTWDKIAFWNVELEDDEQMKTSIVKDVSKNALVSKGSMSSSNASLENPFLKGVSYAAA